MHLQRVGRVLLFFVYSLSKSGIGKSQFLDLNPLHCIVNATTLLERSWE